MTTTKTTKAKIKLSKLAKTILMTISALGLFFSSNVLPFAGKTHANPTSKAIPTAGGGSESAEITYMISPTLLAADGTNVVIFDSADNKLKVHNGSAVTDSATVANVVDMLFSNEALYVLSKTGSETTLKAYLLDENKKLTEAELVATNFNFSIINAATCFAAIQTDADNSSLFFEIADGSDLSLKQINAEKTGATQLTLSHIKSIPISDLSGTLPVERTTALAAIKTEGTTELFTSSPDGIFKLNITDITPYPVTKVSETAAAKLEAHHIGENTFLAFTNENGLHIKMNNEEETLITNEIFSDISFSGKLFASRTGNSPLVKQFDADGENPAVFAENNFSHKQKADLFSGTATKFAKTTEVLPLLEYPYSLTSSTTIPESTFLIILAEDNEKFANHYYVMHHDTTTNENKTGYVQKSKTALLVSSQIVIDLKTTVEAKITKYPSVKPDVESGINEVIETIKAKTAITAVGNAADITIAGVRFFLVETESGLGFIARGKTTLVSQKKAKAIKTNAGIKKDTMLFENADGTGEITLLSKHTRVKIQGSLNTNTKYTKVTISTNTGETLTGYVQTPHLEADGLTSLQVVGIVLCVANIFILILIISLGKKLLSKK